MSNSIFYTIGIAFASGIFTRSFFVVGIYEVICILVLSFSCAVVWRKRSQQYLSPLFLGSLALFCFALGVLRLDMVDTQHSNIAQLLGNEVELTGVVMREPEYREVTVHLYVELDEYDERILVTTDPYQQFEYGDRVAFQGVLEAPTSFETDLGRTFNYPGYLKARGVSYVVSFAEVSVEGRGAGSMFLSLLLAGKHRFMDKVEQHIPEPTAGLGEGLLLGVKRALGDDLEEVFRTTGIIHIVVLSGYNVMLVAEAIMRLLSFVFLPRTRLIIGIVGIGTFALLVGMSATVVRASVMAVLVLIARATGRIYAILRALMLAGVGMLLINPYLLAFDPGFQLSFLATLGLVFLAPLLEERLRLVPTTLQIREFVTATIATQIMVLPLLLYMMGMFSSVSVFVNVLVLPMVPIAMFLTFFVGVSGFISPFLASAVGFLGYISMNYIILVAEFFASLPFASFSVPAFPFWVVVALYAGLAVLLTIFPRTKEEETEIALHDSGVDDYSDWTIEEYIEPELGKNKVHKEKTVFPFR